MDAKEVISNNIKAQNKDMEVLRQHFSHCFTKDGAFDFNKFKAELSETEIDFYKESYGLDWLGKSYARLLASDEATTFLKEDEVHNQKEENKTAENLLIKGDNLEVLKHLSNAYYEKIKMIYIDPPYNTGSDGFVYNDDRKFSVPQLKQLAGVSEEKAKQILDFTQSSSNSHSAWLTFMYPRLYIAKQLLKEDGVIFISIDDNEVAQLRLLMDEIFGEENFVGEFIWKKKQGGGNDSNSVVIEHEYIICFSKFVSNLNLDKSYKLDDALYPYKDSKGDFGLVTLDKSSIRFSESLVYDIKDSEGNVYKPRIVKGKQSCWRWGKKKVEEQFDELVFRKGKVYTKYYRPAGITPKSLLIGSEYGRTETGNDDIKSLFDNRKPFSYPKPIALIKHLSMIGASSKGLILDFFAGSGTTADAVMQLNAEDGGERKFILAQLPEPIDPKKNKTAYDFVKDELGVEEPTIFEITKERIKRASKKIKEETIKAKIIEKENEIKALNSQLDLEGKDKKIAQLKIEIEQLKKQDLGFKVFETTPIWDDYQFEADELNELQKIFEATQLSDDDVKTLLTTWKTYDGIALTESLATIQLDKYTAYYGAEKLYLMHRGFTTESLKSLLEKIDSDKNFNPTSIIAFGYMFESKNLREIAENVKSYANKKNIDIDFSIRY